MHTIQLLQLKIERILLMIALKSFKIVVYLSCACAAYHDKPS
jgi:hypothetical protein